MSENLLDDDFDWDNIHDDLDSLEGAKQRQPVAMLRTFNTEEQAHLVAATLRTEGVDAHIVSSATSQMTPFAYGNVRLYVAQSQVEKAEDVLKEFNARQEVYADPSLSAGRILVILVAGLFVIGLILRLAQTIFGYF